MPDKDHEPTQQTEPEKGKPIASGQHHALTEAKRLIAVAESHERRVALREESARFLDERGETEGAEHERREAELERDAARDAWDRAQALQGPTQLTDVGLEIPIPSRAEFLSNLDKVAPRTEQRQEPGEPEDAEATT